MTALVSGQLNVYGIYKIGTGKAAQVIPDATPVLDKVKEAVPELERVAMRGVGQATISSPTLTLQPTTLFGVDIANEPRLASWLRINEGRIEIAIPFIPLRITIEIRRRQRMSSGAMDSLIHFISTRRLNHS